VKQSVFGFLATPAGRFTRVVVGLALIVLGVMMQNPVGWVIAAVGVVPTYAGIFDVCVISRLMGGPFQGSEIRQGR
jgi:hypothetical protein